MAGLMGAYRAVWWTAAGCTSGVGVVIGLVHHQGRQIAGLVALAALLSGTVSYLTDSKRKRSRKFCRGLTAGVLGGISCFAVAGLSTLMGPAATLIVLLFALTSPHAIRWYQAGRRKASRQTPVQQASAAIKQEVLRPAESAPRSAAFTGSLTVAELCFAWRTSFTALQRIQCSRDIAQQARLVSLRQAYLDELERRDPSGFQRWLYAGARPASDPSKYVESN